MSTMLKTICCICLVLIATETMQAQEWRKIRPLRSTLTDVERLLGKEYGRKSPITYYREKFNVSVTYADGLPCNENEKYGWKVPKDTVLDFVVFFKPEFAPKLSEFKFDFSKFRKMPDPHFPDFYYYESDEEGIFISIEGEGVSNISYRAPKKDWKLMCTPPAAPNNSFNRSGDCVSFMFFRTFKAG